MEIFTLAVEVSYTEPSERLTLPHLHNKKFYVSNVIVFVLTFNAQLCCSCLLLDMFFIHDRNIIWAGHKSVSALQNIDWQFKNLTYCRSILVERFRR